MTFNRLIYKKKLKIIYLDVGIQVSLSAKKLCPYWHHSTPFNIVDSLFHELSESGLRSEIGFVAVCRQTFKVNSLKKVKQKIKQRNFFLSEFWIQKLNYCAHMSAGVGRLLKILRGSSCSSLDQFTPIFDWEK